MQNLTYSHHKRSRDFEKNDTLKSTHGLKEVESNEGQLLSLSLFTIEIAYLQMDYQVSGERRTK